MTSDETTIAYTLNHHIVNITKILNPTEIETMEHTLSEIRDRCKDRQSIVKTRSQMSGEKTLLSFKSVTSDKTLKTITSLKNNKGALRYTIPVKILKVFIQSFLPYLARVTNHSVATSSFPDELKLAEVMSTFKKDDLLDKEKYRPISLSHTSKIFQKMLLNQINDSIELIFQTSS